MLLGILERQVQTRLGWLFLLSFVVLTVPILASHLVCCAPEDALAQDWRYLVASGFAAWPWEFARRCVLPAQTVADHLRLLNVVRRAVGAAVTALFSQAAVKGAPKSARHRAEHVIEPTVYRPGAHPTSFARVGELFVA
jgi:hypothetical protein